MNPYETIPAPAEAQKAFHDVVIAEAPKEELIRIEGNWYFPPTAMKKEFYRDSDHHTICPLLPVQS